MISHFLFQGPTFHISC